MEFSNRVQLNRIKARDKFLQDWNLDSQWWQNKTWDQWHQQESLLELQLQPLGGHLKFIGTELETVEFSFQNKSEAKIFGINVEVNPSRRWSGSVLSNEFNHPDAALNEAAREAINTLLELMFLRSVQH